ncbi:nucleotide cyclase [Dunaliella salina]|uniref:Nucleotide cyclase n=1 Tax=Dunaliella salina TaxID=3046 RepID=A0ABQ7G594_DUNSA|nr:nucleotide cyclase [Dunaliella salina]|eukprot:KAF5829774.1 nucleotide cyclase [Dunaliella salina]
MLLTSHTFHKCEGVFKVSTAATHTRQGSQEEGSTVDLEEQHAIEFLAKRDSNADTIPQNVGKLARSHKMATVLFMDICGFTSMSKAVEPHKVLEMLNTLFSAVDKLTDEYKVHKVETAGDCYIVSCGVLWDQTSNGFQCTLDNHDHPEVSARRMMEFAKAVLQETGKAKMPNSSEPVQMRVGIHSGDVVSGLIGSKLPKFSIFGDTMNTAARMESTGKPGRIHVSETTQGLLPEYAWEAMGKINVKGKVWNNVFWIEGVLFFLEHDLLLRQSRG